MHKEFVPEGKTVNAEFYKGVLDRLLKRIQHPFCCRDFFCCCTIMRPPTKLQVFANFWPKKCYNPLSLPVLSRFISARLFSLSQVENEVKRTPHCGCCWDPRGRNWWIEEGPKTGIFASFTETVRPCKSLYIYVCVPMELILNKKNIWLHVSSIKKKICPKTFGPHCVYWSFGWKSLHVVHRGPTFFKFVPKFLANLCTPYVNLHHTNR